MKKLLILLVSLGCSSYTLTTPTEETLTGKWNLTAVNGTPLPYTVPQIGPKQEVVEDVLTIAPSNTFTEVTTIHTTENGQVTTRTVTDAGTYEYNSYAVT